MSDIDFVRRRLLLGAVTAAGAATMIANSAQATDAQGAIDLTDPANRGLVYRKLVWSLGAGRGVWWIHGAKYAQMGVEMTPLWNTYFAAPFVTRDRAEGGYELTVLPMLFYTDLKTGEFVRKFVNPITGKPGEIGYRPIKAVRTLYDDHGPMNPTSAIGMRVDSIGEPIVEGGQVWMREDHRFSSLPSASRPYHAADLITYFASAAAMSDPAIRMAPALQTFSEFDDWPDWLGMGDIKGCVFSRTYGQKVASFGDAPPQISALIKQQHPEIYRDIWAMVTS